MKTGAPDRGAREKNRFARCRRALAFSFLYLPGQWHNVLLKHPGAVPAGAGGLGGGSGEFAPFRWQKAHTVAFPPAVDVWTKASPGSQFDGCGVPTPP